MNFRLVAKQFGLLIMVLSGIMSVIGLWALYRWRFSGVAVEEHAWWALLASAGIGAAAGGLIWMWTRGAHDHLGRREALLLVALSWLGGAVVAGLPYFLWARFDGRPNHPFASGADCYFEAMSGLTTTGSTILGTIQKLPPSMLLWRALTHWLGGLGIVVLFVAVLPSLGASGKRMFRAEAPGPATGGVRPHIRDTARALWLIYLGLTVISILALRATGAMGWFDSVCHTFAVPSTGGFSTRDSSIAHYDSLAVDLIIMVLMLLAGVNFALFYRAAQGRLRSALKDTEMRVYFALKLIVIVLVTINLYGHEIVLTTGRIVEQTLGETLRYSAFTTIALHTGTGFATADYSPWPFYSRALLIGLMFVGGCAGFTAGGVKVIRLWIVLKIMLAELERAFRPNVVRPLKIGSSTVETEMKLSAVVYCVVTLSVFCLGAVAVQLLELGNPRCDFVTASTASLASICNVGPGLGAVDATNNYGWFSAPSKLVLCLLMALGRLEIFAILVLFSPRFWRGN